MIYRVLVFLVLLLGLSHRSHSAEGVFWGLVDPHDTDACITSFTNGHIYSARVVNFPAMFPNLTPSRPRGKLLVFLPGTGAIPATYFSFITNAAGMGYHALGLTYFNPTTVNEICSYSEVTNCHEEVRLELIDGVDRSGFVSISRCDSIENRLIRLLEHLVTLRPAMNWGQFLSGTNVIWSNVVVAGHSQGGGHAAMLAKTRVVDRCLMFSSIDWYLGDGPFFPEEFQQPAGWYYHASQTPLERYFGFVHEDDDTAKTNQVYEGWSALGLDAYGENQRIDGVTNYLFYSHRLISDAFIATTNGVTNHHGTVVTDGASPTNSIGEKLYVPVWEYMLAAPTLHPRVGVIQNGSGQVAVTYATRPGSVAITNRYQLQVSTNFSDYVNTNAFVVGDGTIKTSTVSGLNGQAAFRMRVDYNDP